MAGFSDKAKDCFTKYATKCSNVPSVIRTDIEKYFRLTASLPTMQYNKPFFNYMPAIMDNLFLFVGNSVCTDIVEGDYRIIREIFVDENLEKENVKSEEKIEDSEKETKSKKETKEDKE